MRVGNGWRRVSSVMWIVALATVLGLMWPQPLLARYPFGDPPPAQERRFFKETGFWVSGAFLAYFDANGGLEVFGYPISAPYNNHGILVQYFQKARMEWHPFNPDPYKVQLGLLGEELGFRRPAVAPPRVAIGRVYYPETGHSVAYMFLRYFEGHGGVDLFGYPISEMLIENQRVVQYFQRLKLVWDPRTAQMSVGNLGELYVSLHRDRLPPDALMRGSYSYRIAGQGSVSWRILVGVGQSVANLERMQEIRILVTDERGDPVTDAQVRVTVRPQDGEIIQALTRVVATDVQGRVELSLPVTDLQPGAWAVLLVEATDGVVSATAQELFLVWY